MIKIVDACVADVDVPEITAARPIPREERLAEAQRAPPESSAKAQAEAKVNADTEVRTAKPSDQSGSVKRPLPVRSRCPTPRGAKIHPTAIVERSESPRSSVYPSPSPRRLPDPLPIAIRRPSRCDSTGFPHVSIFRRIVPGSVLIQIAGSNHAGATYCADVDSSSR